MRIFRTNIAVVKLAMLLAAVVLLATSSAPNLLVTASSDQGVGLGHVQDQSLASTPRILKHNEVHAANKVSPDMQPYYGTLAVAIVDTPPGTPNPGDIVSIIMGDGMIYRLANLSSSFDESLAYNGGTRIMVMGSMTDDGTTIDAKSSMPEVMESVDQNNHITSPNTTRPVLVVRVVVTGTSPPEMTSQTEDELRNDIFSIASGTETTRDPLSPATQYDACSYGQLQLVPSDCTPSTNDNLCNDGVTTVTISRTVNGTDVNTIVNEVTAAVNTNFNLIGNGDPFGNGGPNQLADHVLYCLPPSSTFAGAFAYVNSWLSVYDDLCNNLSVVMHELGHNLGLRHSNDIDNVGEFVPGDMIGEYGDRSGPMGQGYAADDGPAYCFNGAKSWQLGWYDDHHETIDQASISNAGCSQTLELVGVAEYGIATDDQKVVVRIDTLSDEVDYYIAFNRGTGINEGTWSFMGFPQPPIEGLDQVLITTQGGNGVSLPDRLPGTPETMSQLEAKLETLGMYNISDFDGNGNALKITVNSIAISSNPDTASTATITVELEGCDDASESPTSDPSSAPSQSPSTEPSGLPSSQPRLPIDNETRVLVVRVIDADGQGPFENEDELRNDIFSIPTSPETADPLSPATQYAACSHGKLQLVPSDCMPSMSANLCNNGVTTVMINSVVNGTDINDIVNNVTAALNTNFGLSGPDGPNALADYVLYCLPEGAIEGDGFLGGFSYLNSWLSVYDDECYEVSTVMHELGHNFGLRHSNVLADAEIEGDDIGELSDRTGLMGFTYEADDFPRMCFNGPKSWQLGWYIDRHETIDLASLRNADCSQTFELVGVAEYDKATGDQKVIVRIVDPLREFDWYIAFNRQVGMNNETQEGGDQVLITTQGGNGASLGNGNTLPATDETYSNLEIILDSVDDFISILPFDESGNSLTINVNQINTGTMPGTANITIELEGCDDASESPTSEPSSAPSQSSSTAPSGLPSSQPSFSPSLSPSSSPSGSPTLQSSNEPSSIPSLSPSSSPSGSPNLQSSNEPSSIPSLSPSSSPSGSPTLQSSNEPSSIPSLSPSSSPSGSPTLQSSNEPSSIPSLSPSSSPSGSPTLQSSNEPSSIPSLSPSSSPSKSPTLQSSNKPSSIPSEFPSQEPSKSPSSAPSAIPSSHPSLSNAAGSANQPSSQPSLSSAPSASPSVSPSSKPSETPSSSPTELPSSQPSSLPSSIPSALPSLEPSAPPSSNPTVSPSSEPSSTPSLSPSSSPSGLPSSKPSSLPSSSPSFSPSTEPSVSPSRIPIASPSSEPSSVPSISSPPTGLSSEPSSRPSQCPSEEAYISNYWVPPLDKPGVSCENKRLKIPEHGEFLCMPVGEGICRDNGGYFGEWRFGVEEVERPLCNFTGICPQQDEFESKNTFPVLIDPGTIRYPLTGTTYTNRATGKICRNANQEAIRGCNYAGTTHICIGENIEADAKAYSNERPYMFFYNEKTHKFLYQLVCDGAGTEGKLPQLKMVNNEEYAYAQYIEYPVDIVKFKKGPTPNPDDANELWKMFVDWNGYKDSITMRVGQLGAYINVAHPKFCKEYVSPTSLACWKEDCDSAPVATPEAFKVDDCNSID